MKIFCFFLILLTATPFEEDHFKKMIVWNVGQGQWVTFVHGKNCIHIDMGGDKAPWKDVKKVCPKKNFIALTHYDWDHISFLKQVRYHLRHFCLFGMVRVPESERKRSFLSKIPICSGKVPQLEETHYTSFSKKKDENAHSRIFILSKKILIPGDSPKSEETHWAPLMKYKNIKVLVLGHHGSHTSTSQKLLNNLKTLKLALVSAKFSKYGHPHWRVSKALKRAQIPMLKTEVWNNIVISLK